MRKIIMWFKSFFSKKSIIPSTREENSEFGRGLHQNAHLNKAFIREGDKPYINELKKQIDDRPRIPVRVRPFRKTQSLVELMKPYSDSVNRDHVEKGNRIAGDISSQYNYGIDPCNIQDSKNSFSGFGGGDFGGAGAGGDWGSSSSSDSSSSYDSGSSSSDSGSYDSGSSSND